MASLQVPTAPGQPVQVDLKKLYRLTYRGGRNPYPMEKVFEFHGDRKDAIERGRQHCNLMSLRFISVYPLMTDLDQEEKIFTQSGDQE